MKTNTKTKDPNSLLDNVFMGAAWAFALFATYMLVLSHVQASGWLRYALAGLGTAGLLYVALAPLFRKR